MKKGLVSQTNIAYRLDPSGTAKGSKTNGYIISGKSVQRPSIPIASSSKHHVDGSVEETDQQSNQFLARNLWTTRRRSSITISTNPRTRFTTQEDVHQQEQPRQRDFRRVVSTRLCELDLNVKEPILCKGC